ncbi:MAG: M23 family metallopeptidase [Rhodothermales bacterium]|nr:M23 family metallopeptidase [Rhodothermales bacterium]MDG2016107.1 M23 family metallopeptidase [Rhodothermales bacterium]
MIRFLAEFIQNIGQSITLIVMDKAQMEQPRTYNLEPKRVLTFAGLSVFVLFSLLFSLLLLTPIRYSLPGYGTVEMRREARLNQLRLESMSDSLSLQDAYLNRLRDMILGNVDTSAVASSVDESNLNTEGSSLVDLPLPLSSGDWEDHSQPALSISSLNTSASAVFNPPEAGPSFLSALSFPVLPPASGFLTRDFDARTSHFAVDVAAEEGSVVRSIGDGYVVLADWLNDGGQIIAVAHSGGFLSVYKHNSRLLKQMGDRVRDREAIALSGNTGEITTGPHVHFELWHEGLAQDPRAYVLGW